MISSVLSQYYQYNAAMLEAANDAAIRDNSLVDIAAFSQQGAVSECGYSLNLRLDAGSNPGVYTNPETRVYLTGSAREVFDNLGEAYNQSTGASYTTDTFIQDMQNDTSGSIVPNISKTPSETNAFLSWCGEQADLVYRDYDTDIDGTEHFEGDVVQDSILNYEFIKNRDTSPNTNYKYHWE